METVKIKLNANLRGHKKGEIISVKSRHGKVLDLYWRRRLAEAVHNNCIELINSEKSEIKKSAKKVKDSKSDV